MIGFVKLHRQLLNWEWYTDLPVKVLFLHLLLKANHKPEKWRGIEILSGQFVTSYDHLAKETGLTLKQVRTALTKLKSTNEITYKGASRYSIISINNWNKWQANDTQRANKGHTKGKQRATIKEVKNDKEDKNISLSINEKITQEEREILKKHIQKQTPKVQNISAYIRTILDNGDYIHILNEEKAKAQRRLEIVKSSPPEEIQEPDDPIANRKAFEDFKAKLSNLRKMKV